MIYAFSIKMGWQCPRCGKGKMRVTACTHTGDELHRCPNCNYFERLFHVSTA